MKHYINEHLFINSFNLLSDCACGRKEMAIEEWTTHMAYHRQLLYVCQTCNVCCQREPAIIKHVVACFIPVSSDSTEDIDDDTNFDDGVETADDVLDVDVEN